MGGVKGAALRKKPRASARDQRTGGVEGAALRKTNCAYFSWGEGVLPSWRAPYGQPPVVAQPLPYPNGEQLPQTP